LLLHRAQIRVVAKAAEPTRVNARLLRVNFPRMKIEDRGLFLDAIEMQHRSVRHCIRQHAEVPAPRDGKIEAAHANGGEGHLGYRQPAISVHNVKETLVAGNTVAIVPNREDAGIVFESLLREDVERPEAIGGYRIARRTIAENRLAYNVLNGALG